MLRKYCDFDEGYYAYYSDLEIESEEGSCSPLYIGNDMSNTRQGKLFIISGPSGVGKTTLVDKLLIMIGNRYNIHRVITYTTKLPRPGESNGIDYHFISKSDFESKLASNFFIEYSNVYGHYYGSPRGIINELSQGKSFVLIVDQLGAYNIKKQYVKSILIWIRPPSLDELASRLQNRATETEDDVQKRLMIARNEIETEAKQQLFDYFIENNILIEALDSLINIFKAEITSGSTDC